jgi:hypothetical protein
VIVIKRIFPQKKKEKEKKMTEPYNQKIYLLKEETDEQHLSHNV